MFRSRLIRLRFVQTISFHRSLATRMSPPYDFVRRRLVVGCDGTWQSSVSGEANIPSNVTRLCRHLARSEVVEEYNEKTQKTERVLYNQMVWYDAGIGSGDMTSVSRAIQGGTGAGLSENVIQAYNWLVLNYQPGDKIYCFGFSRGAYTARSLAGFIADLGICEPLDMQWFPYVYQRYENAIYPATKNDSEEMIEDRKRYEEVKTKWRDGKALDFTLGDKSQGEALKLNTGPRRPIPEESKQVEVVGVWDTVGSLGVPKIGGWLNIPFFSGGGLDKPGFQFHDVSISNNVRHAFHALALDERRKPFLPTLWYVPFEQQRAPGLSLKQVWFPGVHTNVGGGSNDLLKERISDGEQIAVIAFSWMVEQVRPYLAFDETILEEGTHKQIALMQAVSKPTVWSRGVINDSYGQAGMAIKLGGAEWRAPGYSKQPASIADKYPQRTNEVGVTNEEIHPCVLWRILGLKERSNALDGYTRQACKDPKQGWEWVKEVKDGKFIRIPEYHIGQHNANSKKPVHNLERSVAELNGAGDFLKTLDEMYATGTDKTPSIDDITDLQLDG